METINGINFEEYAALAAHLAQGVSEDEVMNILELDKSSLDEVIAKWNNKLASLMEQDMQYAAKFGEIFANPKVGRFADVKNSASSAEDLLSLVPTYEHFLDIFFHNAVAVEHGIDPLEIYQIYGLNVGQWGTISMYYKKQDITSLDQNSPNYAEEFMYHRELMDRYKEKWEEHYANHL